jgi:hypothetical protein
LIEPGGLHFTVRELASEQVSRASRSRPWYSPKAGATGPASIGRRAGATQRKPLEPEWRDQPRNPQGPKNAMWSKRSEPRRAYAIPAESRYLPAGSLAFRLSRQDENPTICRAFKYRYRDSKRVPGFRGAALNCQIWLYGARHWEPTHRRETLQDAPKRHRLAFNWLSGEGAQTWCLRGDESSGARGRR